jgi:hypothetical protein
MVSMGWELASISVAEVLVSDITPEIGNAYSIPIS